MEEQHLSKETVTYTDEDGIVRKRYAEGSPIPLDEAKRQGLVTKGRSSSSDAASADAEQRGSGAEHEKSEGEKVATAQAALEAADGYTDAPADGDATSTDAEAKDDDTAADTDAGNKARSSSNKARRATPRKRT